MKISLNQPNGFTHHFAHDPSKYTDVQATKEHRKNRFNPYVDNGGTVVGLAGNDFVVVGGDTRLSQGYSIITRSETKLAQLTPNTILATCGMHTDFNELRNVMSGNLEKYEFKMGRQPTTQSIAHLLSKTLYSRRFFPYYTFNLVAGLTQKGEGVVYGYDAIGSYGADKGMAQGSGAHMILPYLDAEIIGYNNPKHNEKPPLSIEKAVQIVQKAFYAAAERDICTGDTLEIIVLTKEGAKKMTRQLRKD